MLGRLMKYELRMQLKTFLIVNIGIVLATAASFGIDMFANLIMPQGVEAVVPAPIEIIGFVGCVFALLLLIMATGIVTALVLLLGYLRYYRTMYTSTGYMTLMLPVSAWKIVVAKGLSLFIYYVSTAVIAIASIGIQVFFLVDAFSPDGLVTIFNNFITNLPFAITELIDAANVSLPIILSELIVFFIIMTITSICVVYMSITIGSVIAKKNKGLIVILIYFGINMLMSLITQTAYTVFLYLSFANFYIFLGMLILFYLGLGVGTFFLNNYLLTKKLNLE